MLFVAIATPTLNIEFIANQTAEQRGMKPRVFITLFATVKDAAVKVHMAKLQCVDTLD